MQNRKSVVISVPSEKIARTNANEQTFIHGSITSKHYKLGAIASVYNLYPKNHDMKLQIKMYFVHVSSYYQQNEFINEMWRTCEWLI